MIENEYRTKREIATALLREAIIRGELRPGGRLLLEELSRRFHLSLTPIREALPLLEAEGLVIQSAHKGAIVAPMDRDEIREVYAIRGAIEGLATAEAVPQLTADDQAALAAQLDTLEAFRGDWEEFLNLDKEFHLILYRAAGNRRWLETIRTLWQRSARYMLASTALPGAVAAIHADHRELLRACQQRDATSAAAVLRTHLDHSAQRLLSEWPE